MCPVLMVLCQLCQSLEHAHPHPGRWPVKKSAGLIFSDVNGEICLTTNCRFPLYSETFPFTVTYSPEFMSFGRFIDVVPHHPF